MLRSKHIIFFTTFLSFSTVFGSEAAFGPNTPEVSSTRFMPQSPPARGEVIKYRVGASWNLVPGDAGWQIVFALPNQAPEDKSTSERSHWFGWVGSWLWWGAPKTEDPNCTVFDVAEHT